MDSPTVQIDEKYKNPAEMGRKFEDRGSKRGANISRTNDTISRFDAGGICDSTWNSTENNRKTGRQYYDVSPQVIRQRIDNGLLTGNWIAGSWFVALDIDGADDEREPNAITLWHGTTEERAKAIIKDGFKPKMPRAGVWFTAKPSFARQFAGRRSYNRTRVPIVFCCDINLEANRDALSQPSRFHIYVFDVPRLKCRIRHIEILEKDRPPTPTYRTENTDATDVTITRTAGRLGVLWWMNRFLELNNEEPVDGNHPAVDAVFQWITTQYDNGRIDAISDDEMLVQVMRHLK